MARISHFSIPAWLSVAPWLLCCVWSIRPSIPEVRRPPMTQAMPRLRWDVPFVMHLSVHDRRPDSGASGAVAWTGVSREILRRGCGLSTGNDPPGPDKEGKKEGSVSRLRATAPEAHTHDRINFNKNSHSAAMVRRPCCNQAPSARHRLGAHQHGTSHAAARIAIAGPMRQGTTEGSRPSDRHGIDPADPPDPSRYEEKRREVNVARGRATAPEARTHTT
jgi:hypothetical protein